MSTTETRSVCLLLFLSIALKSPLMTVCGHYQQCKTHFFNACMWRRQTSSPVSNKRKCNCRFSTINYPSFSAEGRWWELHIEVSAEGLVVCSDWADWRDYLRRVVWRDYSHWAMRNVRHSKSRRQFHVRFLRYSHFASVIKCEFHQLRLGMTCETRSASTNSPRPQDSISPRSPIESWESQANL